MQEVFVINAFDKLVFKNKLIGVTEITVLDAGRVCDTLAVTAHIPELCLPERVTDQQGYPRGDSVALIDPDHPFRGPMMRRLTTPVDLSQISVEYRPVMPVMWNGNEILNSNRYLYIAITAQAVE
jgi:hypothetical protein